MDALASVAGGGERLDLARKRCTGQIAKGKTDSLLNAGGVIVYKMEMEEYSYAAKGIWYCFRGGCKSCRESQGLAGLQKVEKGLEERLRETEDNSGGQVPADGQAPRVPSQLAPPRPVLNVPTIQPWKYRY
ncbi:hypothetical protein CHU98_g11335 [Xylaria longipes]|nr:hypothetical protein CHU98_g11335 [Xylaria longipes]